MNEIWKPIDGWPYEISSLGRVRRSAAGKRTHVGLLRALHIDKGGYLRVTLHQTLDGHRKRWNAAVHRLVAHAFLGPPGFEQEVHHKDSNRLNAALDNLCYVTRSENLKLSDSLSRKSRFRRGIHHPLSKLNPENVREIRARLAAGEPMAALARDYGVSSATIYDLRRGKTWSYI